MMGLPQRNGSSAKVLGEITELLPTYTTLGYQLPWCSRRHSYGTREILGLIPEDDEKNCHRGWRSEPTLPPEENEGQ